MSRAHLAARTAGLVALVTVAACGDASNTPPPPVEYIDAAPTPDASVDTAPDAAPDAKIDPPDRSKTDADHDGIVDASDCAEDDGTRFRIATIYPDGDRDHHGDGAAAERCIGTDAPDGFALNLGDCAPGDGAAWQTLAYTFRDADKDGRYIAEDGAICSGDALPATYLARHPGTEPDCAPGDNLHWQQLPYAFHDADKDGRYVPATGTQCSGATLPEHYLAADPRTEVDCAPGDILRWEMRPAYHDTDKDGVGAGLVDALCLGSAPLPEFWSLVGTDCEPGDRTLWRLLPYAYRDSDGDGATVPAPANSTVCGGEALPAGYTDTPSGLDCAPGEPSLYRTVDLYADTDNDHVGAGPAISRCIGRDVPDRMSLTDTDCEPGNIEHWQLLPYAYIDHDGDDRTAPAAAGSRACQGAAVLPPYYIAPVGNDCDDDDELLYRWVLLYADGDDDHVGVPPSQTECLGDTLPEHTSTKGYDIDDSNPNVIEDEEADDELFDLIFN